MLRRSIRILPEVISGQNSPMRWAAVWQQSIESGRKERWHPLGQRANSA
jgi:hypothetical protein